MTKEQEAQQAQTKQRERVYGLIIDMPLDDISHPENIPHQYWLERCRRAESIVDSQAQKIAEQAKEIERLKFKVKAKQVAAMACRIAIEGDPQFKQRMTSGKARSK